MLDPWHPNNKQAEPIISIIPYTPGHHSAIIDNKESLQKPFNERENKLSTIKSIISTLEDNKEILSMEISDDARTTFNSFTKKYNVNVLLIQVKSSITYFDLLIKYKILLATINENN